MNIGTDILYIPRLKKILSDNNLFLKKVYTENELKIADNIKDPINFFATRFAAKEAIIKATNGKYDFKEIEILKEKNGKPLPNIVNNDKIQILLSLSYDNDYAVAFCIINNF